MPTSQPSAGGPNMDFTIRAAASAVAARAARAENLHEPADIAFDLLRKHLFAQRALHDAEEAAGLRLVVPVDLCSVADAREAIMPAVVHGPAQGLIRVGRKRLVFAHHRREGHLASEELKLDAVPRALAHDLARLVELDAVTGLLPMLIVDGIADVREHELHRARNEITVFDLDHDCSPSV